MSKFLDKHPKFKEALGDAGKALAPVLEIASNIPGLQALGTIGQGIDNLENLSDKQKQDAKDTLKQEMAENNELEGLRLADVQDARQRETVIAIDDKAPLINKITLPVLATFVTIGFFGILVYMLKFTIPDQNKSVLDIMLGSLGTAWLSIVGYYFGSSAGSKDKDAQISTLINKQ